MCGWGLCRWSVSGWPICWAVCVIRRIPGCYDGRSSISFSRHQPGRQMDFPAAHRRYHRAAVFSPNGCVGCGPVYGSNRPQVEPVGSRHPRWRPIGFHQEATASAIRNVVYLIYEPRLERSPSSSQGGHHRIRPQRRECGSPWLCREHTKNRSGGFQKNEGVN